MARVRGEQHLYHVKYPFIEFAKSRPNLVAMKLISHPLAGEGLIQVVYLVSQTRINDKQTSLNLKLLISLST